MALRSTVDALRRPSVRVGGGRVRAAYVRCLSDGRGAHVPTRDFGITYNIKDELNGGN